MRLILGYARKLTLSPPRMTQADADAIFAAGWSDQALHDAVSTCGLFNLMNRLVEGHGINADPKYFPLSAKHLHDGGYSGVLQLLGQSEIRTLHCVTAPVVVSPVVDFECWESV